MDFNVGDKVRFLNASGGGIITGFLSSTLATVAIEDGFEIPTQLKELVKIEVKSGTDRFFDKPMNVDVPVKAKRPEKASEPVLATKQPAVADEKVTPLFRQSGKDVTEGLYLLYAPVDQVSVLTGLMQLFLVNNTSYEAVYTLNLKKEDDLFEGIEIEVVPPYHKMLLATYNREELEKWSSGVIQALYFTDKPGTLMRPLHLPFHVKPNRFYKETNYGLFPLAGSVGLLVRLSAPVAVDASPEGVKYSDDQAVQQKMETLLPSSLIDKHRISHDEAEVDLHISALMDDYTHLTKNEIFSYQLDYFERALESALARQVKKVIFIHGIGNGSLRTAITDRIKEYETLRYRTASFARYGSGAIEVTVE